mmetsp:Transcript_16819/g.43715  ORF Transcript_16819/g.43715 Transcript_16819/m.43715 type:complete len:384 (+) Transcript_16819:99-1250(+)
MACCGGQKSNLKKKMEVIEKRFKMNKRDYEQQLKILLLGAGESGKSTIIKQMKVLYGDTRTGKKGYSDEERMQFAERVYRNVLKSTQALANKMLDEHGWELCVGGDAKLEDAMYDLLDIDAKDYTAADFASHTDIFKRLWQSDGFQKAYRRKNEFQLTDSTKYFFEQLLSDKPRTLGTPDYIPSVQDILRAREATTGIHEFQFVMEHHGKSVIFRMLDVGGQRSERRKWIHAFEAVTSILFIAASSEYDQELIEDDTNRMEESLALFEQLTEYVWFKRASFIIFMNKQDLLQKKIEGDPEADLPPSPLRIPFPSFKGPDGDYPAAKKYIQTMYEERYRGHSIAHYHSTTATDSTLVNKVFETVKAGLVEHHLAVFFGGGKGGN